jgi:hypothetical protein
LDRPTLDGRYKYDADRGSGRFRRHRRHLAYRDRPEHQAMIGQFILPVAAQRIAVQYEF